MPHKVVRDPDPTKVVLRSRKRFIERVGVMLREGSSVFISDVDRRAVWKMKKRFAQLSSVEVEADPIIYDGMSGYQFSPRRKEGSVSVR